METPRFRNDIGLFFLLTLAALIRNCFYLTEMHALYYTVHCGHITNLIRVLGNHSMFLERSLARNLVFETFRGLFRPIAYGLLYEGSVDWKFVSEMAVTTVLFICLVTLFVPKSTFKKHNVAWAYTNMEFFLMFADGFIYAMNKIESVHGGKTLYYILGFYLEANLGMLGWMLEDLVFRDLNVLGGIFHNWNFYVYQLVLYPAMFAAQYLEFGDYVFRPEASYNLLTITDPNHKFPLRWKVLDMHSKDAKLNYCLGMSIFVGIFLYQMYGAFYALDQERLKSFQQKTKGNQKTESNSVNQDQKNQQESKKNKKK